MNSRVFGVRYGMSWVPGRTFAVQVLWVADRGKRGQGGHCLR